MFIYDHLQNAMINNAVIAMMIMINILINNNDNNSNTTTTDDNNNNNKRTTINNLGQIIWSASSGGTFTKTSRTQKNTSHKLYNK